MADTNVKTRLMNVDFMRFILIVCIVLFHGKNFYNFGGENLILNTFPGLQFGYICVDFFFIIAGFFLFNNIKINMDTVEYAVKRFFRLAPLVWLFILCSIILNLSLGRVIHFDKYFLKAFLLSSLGFAPELGTVIHWFIPVLFWCSLFYFYLAKIVDKKIMNVIVWLLVVCGYGLALNSDSYGINVHTNNVYSFINLGVARGLAGLGIGYFISMLYKTDFLNECSKVVKWLISFAEIFLTGILGYYLLFSKNLPGKSVFPLILFFSMLFFLFLRNKGVISRVLNNKFSVLLGSWSYAIYVLSTVVNGAYVNYIAKPHPEILITNPLLSLCLLALVEIAVGIAAHYLFEKPVNKLIKNKLFSKE